VPVQASGEEGGRGHPGHRHAGGALDPALATTAFIKEDRSRYSWTRPGPSARPVAAAYSRGWARGAGVVPVRWDDLDPSCRVIFTVHSVMGLLDRHTAWAGELPAPQVLPPELVEEGRSIPVAPGAGHARGQAAQAGPGGSVSWLAWLSSVR